MNDLANMPFEKVCKIYNKYFSLGYLNTNIENKLAIIALITNLTYEINKKNNNKFNCYDILLKLMKDQPELFKNTFLKTLGAIADDMSYGCTKFEDFNIPLKEQPKVLKDLIINNYVPF